MRIKFDSNTNELMKPNSYNNNNQRNQFKWQACADFFWLSGYWLPMMKKIYTPDGNWLELASDANMLLIDFVVMIYIFVGHQFCRLWNCWTSNTHRFLINVFTAFTDIRLGSIVILLLCRLYSLLCYRLDDFICRFIIYFHFGREGEGW